MTFLEGWDYGEFKDAVEQFRYKWGTIWRERVQRNGEIKELEQDSKLIKSESESFSEVREQIKEQLRYEKAGRI